MLPSHRDPQVDVLLEADPVTRLNRVGRAEYRGHHRDHVHQGHAHDAEHVAPIVADGDDDRRLRDLFVLALFGERGCLVDLATDDVTRDDHDKAQQERDTPAPAVERLLVHVVRERQEHRRGENLSRLDALQCEARKEAAPAERRVLENHRARARYLARNREALDEPQYDEEQRCQPADLLVGRQDPDGHRRESHQEHAHDQHGLAAVRVTPVSEEESAYGPGNIAYAVGRQRRDDRDRGIRRREEDLREDQRRRRGIDEEVVVLQRRADPAAGGRLFRLVRAVWLVFCCHCGSHLRLLQSLIK